MAAAFERGLPGVTTSHDRHGSATLPVSVVIPAYQRAGLIGRAVRSALAQLPLPPAQVLVVDDGSSDDTAQEAAAAGATVLRQPVNAGVSAARNAGVEAAVHDWIALLDSDDEWLPGHLERVWAAREGHVLVSDSARMSRSGTVYGNPGRRPRVLRGPAQALWPTNPSPPSCTLLRRADVLAVGGFRGRRLAEDLELWVRLLERGPGLSLPGVGCHYVEHPGQMSAGRGGEMRAAVAGIVEQSRDRPWNTPTLRRRLAAGDRWDSVMDGVRGGSRAGAVGALARTARTPADVVAVATLVSWRLRSRLRGGRHRSDS